MIAIPLEIKEKRVARELSVTRSIDRNIELLLQTPRWGCVADARYGFVFKNLRFEAFNEKEGTVGGADNGKSSPIAELYKKKVSGSSKNINTFAAELQKAIEKYEPRLTDASATLTYVREEKTIYVTVGGKLTGTDEKYRYETTIRIWN